jgi:predicted transposase/invertase (TIGR01784 family)
MFPKPEMMRDFNLHFDIDLKNSLDTAFEEGKAEGKAEGKIEGEKEAALRISRDLLAKGVPLEIVVSTTGLSLEEIRSIDVP